MPHANGMVLKRAKNGLLYLGLRKNKLEEGGYRKNNDRLKCDFCLAEFTSKTRAELHVRQHLTTPKLMCAFCEEPFANLHKLKSHVKKCPDASLQRVLDLSLELGGKQHVAFEELLGTIKDLDMSAPYLSLWSRKKKGSALKVSGPKKTRRRVRMIESDVPSNEGKDTSITAEADMMALELETREALDTLLKIMREQE
ncbi:hypothetical protein [Cacatuid alphaherpesvirus 2]|uniref:C2H2-type domain-containing protein n=1 Tax=Cacatuid alphaherpesvirus 2 TaxID=2604840 RepID=A0A5B9RBG9_9ALPH|nr:hypothetical protein QKT46_gp06 [Cacatuid alphaherpesvirus 2]QEG54105.1 hypothetical protein [Cacatuid alphaherpesvirus 2]